MTDDRNEETNAPVEFEHYGLIITAEPGWDEVDQDAYAGQESRPIILAKEDGTGFVQFSVQPKDMKNGIPAGALRQWLLEMVQATDMGRGFDLVQLKAKSAMILACSFRPDDEFHRLWYWSDRKRLVMVTYSCKGDPDRDELRECAAMVARLRMNRRPPGGRRVKG